MTIEEVKEKSGFNITVAESLYYHSIWLRKADPNKKVNWRAMMIDAEYRAKGDDK